MDASVRLDLGGGARGGGGGVGSGALAAAPSAAAAAAYAAAVSEAALEEAEARVLARATARPRGELDALRDRVDAALGARARRAVGSGGAEAAHGARAAALAAVAAAVKRLAAPPAPGNALRAARASSPSPPLPAPPPPKEAERRDGALPPWPPSLTPEARRAAVAAHEAARAAGSGARPWWLVAREGSAFDARDAHPPWPAAGGEGGARNIVTGAAGARALPAGGGAAALLVPRAAPRTPVAVAPVVDALAIHGCGGGGGGGATAAGRAALAAPPPRGQPLFEPRVAPAACSDAAASDAWIALCCAPLPSYGAGVGGWRGGAAPRSGSGVLDGTLAAAVAALGVVDPWETSAAVMDPTAVSAAVRAAAAASAAVEEEAAAGGGGEALEALLRGSGEGAPPPPVTPLSELLDLTSEIAHLPPFDLRAAAATPVLASGSRATIATPALAPAAESIAARVAGAYEAARRQVALADALECLEEEGGGGSSGGGGGGSGAARGRPPPATLAALTRAVRARAIQRFWRGLVATREARAELDARRSAVRGKEGALRAAVAALLDALGGGESAGGGAQPAGAATSLLRSLQASAAKPPPPPPLSGRPPLQRHVAQAKAQPAGGGFLRYPQRGVGVGGAAAAAAVAARPTLRIEGGAVEGATSAGSSPGLLLLQPITISGAELPSTTSSFLRASSDSLAGV